MTCLLTGGSGLLGQELQKLIKCQAPSREAFNISSNKFQEWYKNNQWGYDLIIHCAAYTDLVSAETNKQECYNVNVIGTRNLTSLGIPMLYISTEYVFDGERGTYAETDYPNPRNFYAYTKLLGEYESRRTRSVVIRCLFKPRPFEHAAACIDQFTTGDYVDVIAREIALAIKKFNDLPETIHIGTGRKSTYDIAKQTRDVIPITIESIGAVRLPKDTSLNTTQWERLKERWNNES